MKKIIEDYIRYNEWANTRLLDFLQLQSQAVLSQEVPSSFNSINKTIQHIAIAQELWMARLTGTPTETEKLAVLNWDHDAVDRVKLSSDKFIQFIENQSDEELNQSIRYSNSQGNIFQQSVVEILQHCMNHSTHHRGQLFTICHQLSIGDIPQTDFIVYLRLKSHK